MSAPQAHPTELLLDFAYQELDPAESRRIEAHLSSCPDCTRELEDIRGVRKAMAPLSPEPPPDAGLESLLAYAEKSARSRREGRPRRAWLVGWVGLAATAGLVVVLGQEARRSLPEAGALSKEAGGAIAYQKSLSAPAKANFGESALEKKEEMSPAQAPVSPPPPPPPVAQRRGASDVRAKAKAAPGSLAEHLQKDRAQTRDLGLAGKSPLPPERKLAKREQGSRAESAKKRSRKVAMAEPPAELEGAGDAFGESRGAGAGASAGALGGRVAGGVVGDELARSEPAQRASKPSRTRMAAAPAARPAPAAPVAVASRAEAPSASQEARAGAAAEAPPPASGRAPEVEAAELRADTASQDPRGAELSRLEAALPHLTGEARAKALERICALQQALGQGAKARATLQVLLRDYPQSAEAARAAKRMAPPTSPGGG